MPQLWKDRERIAPHLLGLPPAPLQEHRLGARRRCSPLSLARCAAAGSRGGLCSGRAGQDPSHRRVPALPELGTVVGVGIGRQGRGPEEHPRLGFRSFAPFRN